MAFTPTIVVSVSGKCTSMIITDTTGVDVGDGTGWDGVAGLTSGGITEADFSITGPSGATASSDVASQITGASPVSGNMEFTGITGTWIDGAYDIEYSVDTGATAGAVVTEFDFFVYCNVQNCVDAMFAKLSTMLCSTPSSTDALNALLARIQRICAFEGCSCAGCS